MGWPGGSSSLRMFHNHFYCEKGRPAPGAGDILVAPPHPHLLLTAREAELPAQQQSCIQSWMERGMRARIPSLGSQQSQPRCAHTRRAAAPHLLHSTCSSTTLWFIANPRVLVNNSLCRRGLIPIYSPVQGIKIKKTL